MTKFLIINVQEKNIYLGIKDIILILKNNLIMEKLD